MGGSDPSMCIPGRGWTCAAYVAKGWCRNNQCIPPSGTGGVYACGDKLNSPEQNCCACGKPEERNNASQCVDTPTWNNGWKTCQNEHLGSDPSMCIPGRGWTCTGYVAKGWCRNNKCLPPSGTGGVYACGDALNSPEQNCCACGKPGPPVNTTCAWEGCFGDYKPENVCQCTYECLSHATCCSDYLQECSPPCGPRRLMAQVPRP